MRVNEQKRSPTRRNYQVLRPDASPRGVNCICELRRGSRGFAGLASHFGRSFLPRSVVLCSGSERLPFHHQARRPSHNRASIGKTTNRVNPISLWKSGKYERSGLESSLIPLPGSSAGIRSGHGANRWLHAAVLDAPLVRNDAGAVDPGCRLSLSISQIIRDIIDR